MGKQIPKILFLASMVSYFISLCVPAFHVAGSPRSWYGLEALILGVVGLSEGFYCWLANPLILGIWILAAIQRIPALVGALVLCGACSAGALCLSFLRH